jgi:hypothetical protein
MLRPSPDYRVQILFLMWELLKEHQRETSA